MKNKTTHLVLILLTFFAFALGTNLYESMPEQMASHWNIKGNPDGYMDKFWAIFLMPIFMLGLYIFYILIPKIDPFAKNISDFRPTFNTFWVGLFTFFFYIFLTTLAWNLGAGLDMAYAVSSAVGLLIYFTGSLLKKTKRNFFMGIRTPWTLTSDLVWQKTHKLGGGLFQLLGVLTMLTTFWNTLIATWVLIGGMILVVLAIILYSYYVFKNIKNYE